MVSALPYAVDAETYVNNMATFPHPLPFAPSGRWATSVMRQYLDMNKDKREVGSISSNSPGPVALNPAELQVLRAQFEKEGDTVGVQTKFNFAWGLVKSSARADQQQGVMLLTEIFRTSPERRRECLYYLALGNYKLGNYAEARRYNELLLEKEPTNQQASNLNTLIDDKVQKEGLVGVAIVSGIAVVAGVVGGVLLRNMGRRR
ncbi:MAG: Mitochondrial fission 1 protein [Sporothrix epigloea]